MKQPVCRLSEVGGGLFMSVPELMASWRSLGIQHERVAVDCWFRVQCNGGVLIHSSFTSLDSPTIPFYRSIGGRAIQHERVEVDCWFPGASGDYRLGSGYLKLHGAPGSRKNLWSSRNNLWSTRKNLWSCRNNLWSTRNIHQSSRNNMAAFGKVR